MEARRERDRILQWVLKSFLVLALIGTVGGFSQFVLSYRLYGEVKRLRSEHTLEQADRASRIKAWDAFREQLQASVVIRDGEITLIRKRLEQLERADLRDAALAQALRDRAKQK